MVKPDVSLSVWEAEVLIVICVQERSWHQCEKLCRRLWNSLQARQLPTGLLQQLAYSPCMLLREHSPCVPE